MSFCRKCGNELVSDSEFCDNCGTPVSKTKPAQSRSDNPETGGPTLIRDKPSYGAVNPEDLAKGFVIDNRYEIKEKLGQGGFGAVYRANDRNLGVDKALKIIPNAVGSDFEAMINLRAETKALINLNHPSIVRVYDFHESGNIKYIDMELIEGKSLSQIKAEAPGCRLPENQVIEYAIQIAEGMAHAHAKGIIHRDIKPQNVIITNDNNAKILDFGIAQTLHTSMSRLTNTSSSGTLVYMSPEQINGQDVGKESDIYSFGAMLYELLSGKPPFWQGAIEHQILNVQPKPLDGVSQHVNSLVMKCLEKDYQKRNLTFEGIVKKLRKPEEEPVKEIIENTGADKQTDKKESLQNQVSNNNNNDWKKPVIVICVIVIVALAGIIVSLINKKPEENSNTVTTTTDVNSPSSNSVNTLDNPANSSQSKTPAKESGNSENEAPEGYVWIPGGTFMMGSTNENDNGKPIHQVTVRGFYIGKTEVTQEEYERVMGTNPSEFKNCPTCPVDNVTWEEAKDYCENVGGRLPTEAEWEYACRAGSTTKYYWGDEIDGDYAWYDGNSGDKTHPVAQKKPNAFGLYDMSGNVCEWCSDLYDKNYYKNSPSQDPQGPSTWKGMGELRILRGGGWISDTIKYQKQNLHSASRDWTDPDLRLNFDGFRCVRSR